MFSQDDTILIEYLKHTDFDVYSLVDKMPMLKVLTKPT
jgi:hypothetical protein